MSLFSARRIAFRHQAQPGDLFSDVSFDLAPGDRVALVGPNGAGKTTLLGIVTGERPPTAGDLVRRRGLRVAGVDQVSQQPAGRPLIDAVLGADPDLAALRATLQDLVGRLDDPAAASRYADALEDYQARGGYAREAQAERVLEGLGLPAALHDAPWGTLSAGQRTRAMLAALLVAPADLLLLDEPTNHLDAEGRAWLVAWLARVEAAVVIVSHDRAFLEATATRVLELRAGTLTAYEGGWGFFREAKALASRHAWAAFEGQQRRHEAAGRAAAQRTALAREMAKSPDQPGLGDKAFYRRKASKVEKAAKVIQARAEREPEAPKPVIEDAIPTFDWGFVPRGPGLPLAARGLAKAYGERVLFTGLTFDVARGDRLAVLGPNGAGKTTLVKLLLGPLAPDAGEVVRAPGAKIGWFGQEAEQLDLAGSALDNLLAVAPDLARARLLLACLRLRGERVFQHVGSMSAGERAKVALARLLLAGCDVLLLDEPTNHLDLDAREAIEATLAGYPGAIVLVSHDQALVGAIATRTLTLGGAGGGSPA